MSISVITAADSFNLTTLSRLKQELSISSTDTSKDAYLTNLIAEASDVLASETKRVFAAQTYEEKLTGSNSNTLAVGRFPINDITSITYHYTMLSTESLSTDSYDIQDANAGILYKETPWHTNYSKAQFIDTQIIDKKHSYTIVYDAGWVLPSTTSTEARTLPRDIEQAALQIASANYYALGRDPMVKSERTGNAEQTLFDASFGRGVNSIIVGYPPFVYNVIQNYKVSI